MSFYLAALLIGVIAGLRAFTAPAAVSWAALLGWLAVAGSPLAFLGFALTPYIATVLAVSELVWDKLPITPSRRAPTGFSARLVSGGLCGAAIGAAGGVAIAGLGAGAIGATIGTIGGHAARVRLAKAMGSDMPAALLEDLVAVGGGAMIVMALAK
jgi:uncharacterized membrane protein